MPIGMFGIYRLLFVCFFVCLQDFGNMVTDISGVGWRREIKLCTLVDIGVRQIFSPFGELWPRG